MYIGYSYGSGRLLVVGTYRSICAKGRKLFFVVKCSECAKDSELFGEGLFKITTIINIFTTNN